MRELKSQIFAYLKMVLRKEEEDITYKHKVFADKTKK